VPLKNSSGKEATMGAPTANAQIYIGGTIKGTKTFDKFVACVNDIKEFTDFDACINAKEAQANGEPYYVSNSDARYGEFTDLEEFCRENDLSYVRYTGSDGGDITPLVQWWTPGMEKPGFKCTNSDGDVTVPLINLQEIFSAVEQVCSQELPKALPLLLNSEYASVKEFVKDTLQRGGIPDPYEYLKQWVKTEYPFMHQDDLPPFKVEV
jgi:hypothetical protein